ncbi:MAG: 3-methyl-2-oxobutanoate hydroxymethyltransferase [Spirochaetes bacterium GWD1_61_31]|nr:MAG: 3-methyl-2-oxobutanoate hydroxymethyltransferase [Spirochaetes bacterium GWB1_60_80]OHD31701.1 MAG: 3-methyl-2-oxobutanoate hydroxymethyltransferase [Spirochaetes bacterium GWC1_61_12]OHD36244.1 MAG: 3-methyl-2-oxobutanoate hydroxymethyltransferase [Spirochaetes bacterium GWD1_61_31]OHD41499.1 MAG: 3-methyl-2-oxobutanoate hydroxymethyltransferase [Spirochaetes bacterium GWE1_60_18]OHD61401.1 MAG: 3-methyl-2-oxobutanoate hydroxymethyltransferase [Spirochaetes bacterium GWF1_60_12]HAP445
MAETRKKMTMPGLFKKVAEGKPLSWMTCYDYPTAVMQDQAGMDMILVGDSLGMTMLGYDSTLPVTMDDMIRHTAAVRRGSPNSWLVGDMPYMSYQPSVETAIRNAGRFMAETGCDSIKLEGGIEMADRIAGIVRSGIPAIGHLGLTPQSVSALGGFRLQGKGAAQAKKIVDDAKALEEAGAFCILLELIPDRLCKLITERAKGCIIMSLGSGLDAHGQLLIYHDAFALYPKFKPRMARVFADAGKVIQEGLNGYVKEVGEKTFPSQENWFGMPDEEFDALLKSL